jgi:hypothetical protein
MRERRDNMMGETGGTMLLVELTDRMLRRALFGTTLELFKQAYGIY